MRLFGKKPGMPSSGHAGDDAVLHEMVKFGAELTEPRHWVHYLYFPDEDSARSAAESIRSEGWGLQRVDQAADNQDSWVVIAEAHGVIVNPDSAREARGFFERVVAGDPRADYDGWEANI